MNSLTKEQFKAVTFLPSNVNLKKHLIIEAGAGAGKTKVLSERVKWLLTQAPIASRLTPNQIFLVTFTNDAQKELKERVQFVLLNNEIQQYNHMIHISTIDGLFDSLVDSIYPIWWEKNHANKFFFQMPPILTLITETEVQRNLEKKVLNFLNENHDSQQSIALIIDFILSGGFKKNSSFLGSSANTLSHILKCMCQDIFLSTDKEKIRIVSNKIHPATTFLISKIHTIARMEYEKRIQKGEFTYADKTVFLRENLQDKCPIFIKELIVDEYQDTNLLQHEILHQLVLNSKGRMVVVGDPKQSIYGFRGASVDVFKSLLDNNEWEHITLNKNFRTQDQLLHEINSLSQIAFEWENPRYPKDYPNSFFHEEAQKKYIKENPLIPGIETENTQSPLVYIVSAFIPSKCKIKINELAPFAYATFLKNFQIENGASWNDIVVLCEKNKQIKALQNAFLQVGIPVKSLDSKDDNQVDNYPSQVGLSLAKCLSGKAELMDYYLIFMSPLVQIPMEEIYFYFSNSKNVTPQINLFLSALEKYKKIAENNFFLAWQNCRWQLATELGKNAVLFCQNMNAFSQALFIELSKSNTRIEIENSIYNSNDFILPENLEFYSILSHDNLPHHETNALEIKTIHKAKGLEWPYVCFYPKYGLKLKAGEFISSQSQNTLDISWLNQDVESFSVVNRIENIHFPNQDSDTDENNKVIRFAELRKEQEENYERQRVFYTALTRPQKKLILFQPTFHHSSKKGIIELASEKKEALYCDYLEQHLYIKYLNSNFDRQSLKENSFDGVQSIFHSVNKKIELTNFNLFELEQQIRQMPPCHSNKNAPSVPLVNSAVEPQSISNSIDEVVPKTPLNESDEKTQKFENIDEILKEKRNKRFKIHKGILLHSEVENKKGHIESLLSLLENNSLLCKREFEIWSQETLNLKSKRNILDMLLLFKYADFQKIFSDKLGFNDSKLIALVVDLKTGQKKQSHVEQVVNYMDLIKQLFLNSKNLVHSLKVDFQELPSIAIHGALVYAKSSYPHSLYFNNEFIEPTLKNDHEVLYLLQDKNQEPPKNRRELLTSSKKEVTI